MNTAEQKSVFRLGAECGLPMGCYLSVMSVASVFADRLPMLGLVVMVMLFATPLVIWYFQRRYWRESEGMAEYSAMWMLGILTMIYGALITGLVTWCVVEWGRPDFLYDQLQNAIDAYRKMPELKNNEILDVMQKAIDTNALPSTIEMVSNMFWLTAFGGSLVSAVTAAFARIGRVKY